MTYTRSIHTRARAQWRGRRRIVRERNSAPSLHGLLIPNFTDNGRGASFFFFTPIHLLSAERVLEFEGEGNRSGVGFARPPGPNALSFFFFFFRFFTPVFSSFARRGGGWENWERRGIWFSSHIRIENRRQPRRG